MKCGHNQLRNPRNDDNHIDFDYTSCFVTQCVAFINLLKKGTKVTKPGYTFRAASIYAFAAERTPYNGVSLQGLEVCHRGAKSGWGHD